MKINFYLIMPVQGGGSFYGGRREFDRKQKKSTTSKMKKIFFYEMDSMLSHREGALFWSFTSSKIARDLLKGLQKGRE
jgi:hypothetical protein